MIIYGKPADNVKCCKSTNYIAIKQKYLSVAQLQYSITTDVTVSQQPRNSAPLICCHKQENVTISVSSVQTMHVCHEQWLFTLRVLSTSDAWGNNC